LADFDEALKLNPRSLAALQNKAAALSDLGRDTEALPVLNRVIELYPDYVMARSGRAVILARMGRRDDAHKDGREALLRDRQPFFLYQVAGVYALTSRTHPEDRTEAFRLLALALNKGFGLEELAKDKDLDPIRECPEFRALVDAARVIQTGTAAKRQ